MYGLNIIFNVTCYDDEGKDEFTIQKVYVFEKQEIRDSFGQILNSFDESGNNKLYKAKDIEHLVENLCEACENQFNDEEIVKKDNEYSIGMYQLFDDEYIKKKYKVSVTY